MKEGRVERREEGLKHTKSLVLGMYSGGGSSASGKYLAYVSGCCCAGACW